MHQAPCPTRKGYEKNLTMMLSKTTLAFAGLVLLAMSSHAHATMLRRGLQQPASSASTAHHPSMAPTEIEVITEDAAKSTPIIYCRYAVTVGGSGGSSTHDHEDQQCLVYNTTTGRITDIVRIDLPPMFAVAHEGELMRGPMLRITGATIVNNRVVLTPTSDIALVRANGGRLLEDGEGDDDEDQDAKFGTKIALAVNVVTPYGDTGSTVDTLRGVVMGNGGPEHEPVNFRSQYYDCSFGQLDIRPAHHLLGNGIKDGVVDVMVDMHPGECDITGSCQVSIINALEDTLGTSLDDFDLVLIAVPHGTIKDGEDGWIAFAYMNRNLAFFNGDMVTKISNDMHEVGHCLGLGHAYYHDEAYADKTGMMGYADMRVGAPKACFNPAMYHALRWMADTEDKVEFTDARDGPDGGYAVRLVAFADKENSHVRSDDKTLLQVDEDIFIAYNHAHGMNAETRIFPNAVTVVENRDARNTELLAALTTDETQEYYRSDENPWPHFAIVRGGLVVEVCDMGRDKYDIEYAIVAIWDLKRGHESPCFKAVLSEAEQEDATLSKDREPASQQKGKCENVNYWVFLDDPDRWRIPCHEVGRTLDLCDTLVDKDGTLARDICRKSCKQC